MELETLETVYACPSAYLELLDLLDPFVASHDADYQLAGFEDDMERARR